MPRKRAEYPEFRLWPFSAGWAILAAIVSFVTLVIAVLVIQSMGAMGSNRMNLTFFIALVIVALIPIFLMVLDAVVANRGALEVPGGLKLSFSEVRTSARVQSPSFAMSANIMGSRAINLADTGGDALLEAMQPLVGREVVILNLGEGDQWWRTRLLLLCSGTVRLGSPDAVVFIATLAGIPERFIGWATPRELLNTLLRPSDSPLSTAYRRASAVAGQLSLGKPIRDNTSLVEFPWCTSGGTNTAVIRDWQSEPERLLLQELLPLEQSGELGGVSLHVSAATVREDFAAVLKVDFVEEAGMSDKTWLKEVLRSTHSYIAVTSDGEYRTLVSRPTVTNAVLRVLVEQMEPSDLVPSR
jgi:hypothetical protein